MQNLFTITANAVWKEVFCERIPLKLRKYIFRKVVGSKNEFLVKL